MSNPRAKSSVGANTKKPIQPVRPPTYKNPSATKQAPTTKPPARTRSAPPKPSPRPSPGNTLNPKPTKNPSSAPESQSADRAPNWINRTVQSYIASYGNFVSGKISNVGNGVNSIGQGINNSISNTTRGWGQGVAGYGNEIKDQVGVGGKRVPTAGNPLGLAGVGGNTGSGGVGAKRASAPAVGQVNRKAGGANPLGL